MLHLGTNGIDSSDALLALGCLTNLTCLKLEGNGLTELHPCVGSLSQLRELAVYGNRLSTLPEELGMCLKLEEIDAHHNELESLPDNLALLKKLKNVYLSANKLAHLEALRDRVFQHLPALSNLGLGANMFDLAEGFALPCVRVGLGWNRGDAPEALHGVLNAQFATSDHNFEPAARGARGDVLIVAFAGQGVGNQQWAAPCAAVRAAGVAIDVLYLADPANAYYMQCPAGTWGGVAHYGKLIKEHSQHYPKVMLVGSSMGGTAALVHARAGSRVLAFGPKISMDFTHGSYLPRAVRNACSDALFDALDDVDDSGNDDGEGAGGVKEVDGREEDDGEKDDKEKKDDAEDDDDANGGTGGNAASKGGMADGGSTEEGDGKESANSLPRSISVHVGGENMEDVLQAERVEEIEGLAVVHHPTFHHNVPMFLEREGALVTLLKNEVLALLLN